MKRAVNAPSGNQSKIDQIRTGATRKTDLGTKENKGVIQHKGGKYKVVETEKKFEEAGVRRKKRNYVLYESKLGTEKETNLQKIAEAPKPKPKPTPVARPRVEEKIIQKKKRIEYLDNYQYHETKVIRNPNRRVSIVKHKRLGPEVGGFYEEMTYQKQSTRDSGKGPVQYSKQTTTTSRRGPAPTQKTTQKTVTTSRTMPAQPREYRREMNLRQPPNRSSGSLNATKTTTTTTTVNRRSNSRPQNNRGNSTTTTTTTTTRKVVTRSNSAGRRH